MTDKEKEKIKNTLLNKILNKNEDLTYDNFQKNKGRIFSYMEGYLDGILFKPIKEIEKQIRQ